MSPVVLYASLVAIATLASCVPVDPPAFRLGQSIPACTLLRTSGRLPAALDRRAWEDDIDCYVWRLNRMLADDGVCFHLLFARSKPAPVWHTYTDRRGRRAKTFGGWRGLVGFDEYKDCYVSVISFVPTRHHDYSTDEPFSTTTIAHASPGGDVHINSDLRWLYHNNDGRTPVPRDAMDIAPTAYHEILHAIGLKHDASDPHAIMYPYAYGQYKDTAAYRFNDNEREQLLVMYGRIGDGSCRLGPRHPFADAPPPRCVPLRR